MPTEPGESGESGLKPASHRCWLYTLEVEPDTVRMPASGEDPAMVKIDVEVFEWGLSPECVGNPVVPEDGVWVRLYPREPFEEDQLAGLPVLDSLPPDLFSFRFADPEHEPSPPNAPWFFSVDLPDSFKVRIQYQTTGVEGEEPLFFRILDGVGDVTGPDTTFTIVTLPADTLGLRVQCDPNPILRGEVITCEAAADDPEAEIEIVEWRFTDGEQMVTYEPDDPADRFWEGAMAVGGTVTVSATVDGESGEVSTTVTVQPREWLDIEQLPTAVEQRCPEEPWPWPWPCPLNYPPTQLHGFGMTNLYLLWVGSFSEIDSGPNQGWSMVLSEGPGSMYAYKYLAHISYYNKILDEPGHPLWPVGCNVANAKNVVLIHEGQHVALLRDSLETVDLAPNDRLERWTLFGPPDSLESQRDDTLSVLRVALDRYADNPTPHQIVQSTLPASCAGFFP